MVRIKKSQPVKARLADILSKLTDEQVTPELRKHIITKFYGRQQKLKALEGVIEKLQYIQQRSIKHDIKDFKRLKNVVVDVANQNGPIVPDTKGSPRPQGPQDAVMDEASMNAPITQHDQQITDSAPIPVRDEQVPSAPPPPPNQSAILRWWQIDKRSGKMRKYEVGVISPAIEVLKRANRKLILDSDAIVHAQRDVADGSEARAWIRELLASIGHQGIRDKTAQDALLWEEFMQQLDTDSQAYQDLNDFASSLAVVELVMDSVTVLPAPRDRRPKKPKMTDGAGNGEAGTSTGAKGTTGSSTEEKTGSGAKDTIADKLATDNPYRTRKLRDMATEKYIANTCLDFELNREAADITELIKPRRSVHYPSLVQSCMPLAIIDKYKHKFEAYKAKYPNTTFPRVFDMAYIVNHVFRREWDGAEDVQLTIDEAADFLNDHKIALEVYNIHNVLIFDRKPAGPLHHFIKPNVMRVVYHNNHVESIDDKKKLHEKRVVPKETFHTPRVTHTRQATTFVDGRNDLFEKIKSAVTDCDSACSHIKVLYNDDLNDLAREIISSGYSPYLSIQSMVSVKSIVFPNLCTDAGKRVTLNISKPSTARGAITSFDANEYATYQAWEQKIETTLMNPRSMSRISEGVELAFDEYAIPVLSGRTHDSDLTVVNSKGVEPAFDKYTIPVSSARTHDSDHAVINSDAVDFSKFYASCLRDAPFIPVISPFSEFTRQSPDEPIDKNRLYIVDIVNTSKTLVYNKGRTLMYGFEILAHSKEVDMRPVASVQLIVKPNRVANEIRKLFSSSVPMSSDHKKAILNKAIGMCGKRFNRSSTTTCFRNEDDVIAFSNDNARCHVKFADGIWMHTETQETRLIEGFRPIHAMILGIARAKMHVLCSKLQSHGADILGFRTDCVYYRGGTVPAYEDTGLGSCRTLKEKPVPRTLIQPRQSAPETLARVVRDTPAPLTTSIETWRPEQREDVLFLGPAGTGKTSAALKHALSTCTKILIVCAWNAQAQNNKSVWRADPASFGKEIDGITLHHLLGLQMDGRYCHNTRYELGATDCVIFDEILLHRHHNLCKIKAFMDSHRTKLRFLGTADPRQLEAIDDDVGNERKVEMLRGVFGRIVTMRDNKRLISADQHARMDALTADIEDPSVTSVEQIVRKHFPRSSILRTIDDVIAKNIPRAMAYYNHSAYTINREMTKAKHAKKKLCLELKDGMKYCKNDKVVCRKRGTFSKLENKGVYRVYPNFEFWVSGWTRTGVVLIDVLEDNARIEVKIPEFHEHFLPASCTTVHSAQGSGIGTSFVIADFRSKFVSKQWLYSAVSRTRDLDNVYFLEQNLHDANVESMLTRMVAGYKHQDMLRFGAYPSDEGYIDPLYIRSEFQRIGGKCAMCGDFMGFETRSATKVTVNRQDNALAHTIENCELICLRCNSSMK